MSKRLQQIISGLLVAQATLLIHAEDPASKAVPLDCEKFPQSEKEIVAQIHRHILATRKIESEADMTDYSKTVPETGAAFHMIALPKGKVTMGSPNDEADRKPDEGPQYEAEVDAFWIGKFEVTWDEFEPFMLSPFPRRKDGTRVDPESAEQFVDLISSPTTPYTEMSFGMGTKGFPAVNMTHLSASKYCQWLSTQTGHFYRLPTEAEWEYACRGETTSPYWFGSDPNRLMKVEVVDPHEIRVGYEKIGVGEPNPFGLYDMHGNVMEWCLDRYVDDRLATLRKQYPDEPGKIVFRNPHIPATTRFSRTARGGCWYDPPEMCRSASRASSEPSWMGQDAQLPKSLWYLTDAHWLGFRLVRPLSIPTAEEMFQIWNSGNVHDK